MNKIFGQETYSKTHCKEKKFKLNYPNYNSFES